MPQNGMSLENHHNDNTKTIIGAGFVAVFALMLLVTWLSMSTLQSVNTDMSELINSMSLKTSRAYMMRDAIRLRSSAVQTLVQTEELGERKRIFNNILDYTSIYETERDKLEKLGVNTREKEILGQVNNADQRLAKAYEDASNALSTVNVNTTLLGSALNTVHFHELILLNHLNEMVKLEKQLADEAVKGNQQKYQETRELLSLIVIASFALSIVISAVVTARVSRVNNRIAHLANHDDLTDLHNRRSFEQHLKQTICIASRSNMAHGLLYIDLDRFKLVNDTCGHQAGDELLIELTRMMGNRLRRGDLFARIGGDEFAIIAQASTFDDIRKLAEELRVLVHDYTFEYDDHSFNVSLSIGVTSIDGSITDLESVLADVDSACYIAKQSGRNQVHIATDNDSEVLKYRSNIAGVQAIRKALHEERLSLFFQPVYAIEEKSIRMTQCEILLRIRSENGELYSPARFIPIAEKYNVMIDIDRWVFNQTIDFLAKHQADHVLPRLLVNLSGLSFANTDFSNFIVERLSRGDIDPRNLAFEISESATVKSFQKASLFIDRIRSLGCELALDDFGSGFSNLAYLKQLNFDYLKIDGSLVKNISENEVDREMVAAINQIGHSVGARTIAEFVEDDVSLQYLREMDVDFVQGYGLRMPAPLEQLTDELEKTDLHEQPLPTPDQDDSLRKAS